VEYDQNGRPIRKSRGSIDYSMMMDDDIDKESEKQVEKWVADLIKRQQ
jgi:hypothetical protein